MENPGKEIYQIFGWLSIILILFGIINAVFGFNDFYNHLRELIYLIIPNNFMAPLIFFIILLYNPKMVIIGLTLLIISTVIRIFFQILDRMLKSRYEGKKGDDWYYILEWIGIILIIAAATILGETLDQWRLKASEAVISAILGFLAVTFYHLSTLPLTLTIIGICISIVAFVLLLTFQVIRLKELL